MKITDLTKAEIVAVLRGRNQPVPAEEPEDAPTYSAEQVDVLRCIDALATALELYIPAGSLLQTRLIQAQYLLQTYSGIPLPPPPEEEPEETEEAPEEEPEKDETYTVG